MRFSLISLVLGLTAYPQAATVDKRCNEEEINLCTANINAVINQISITSNTVSNLVFPVPLTAINSLTNSESSLQNLTNIANSSCSALHGLTDEEFAPIGNLLTPLATQFGVYYPAHDVQATQTFGILHKAVYIRLLRITTTNFILLTGTLLDITPVSLKSTTQTVVDQLTAAYTNTYALFNIS